MPGPPTPSPSDVVVADVTGDVVSVADLADRVMGAAYGAVVTFSGVVRDHDVGRAVASLAYEAHPEATVRIAAVARDCALAHPGVRIAVRHRIGDLRVGDTALAVAVASAHRTMAFTAGAALVDQVKEQVPIWKHQLFADGSAQWMGL